MDPRSPEERIGLASGELRDFCHRWKIREFWLFGSVLREDFGPSSDVDVLVQFEEDAPWSLSDLVEMEDELQARFGRPVDLVEVRSVQNPIRRKHILENRKLL